MNYTLEIALDYLSRGLSVIPLQPQGKKPIISTWKPFETRRATQAQVRGWFTHWPRANIGILTGKISDVIVLDIDGPDGEWSVDQNGGIPHTPVTRTGKGRHVWLQYPDFHVGNPVKFLPGLDLRGDSGLVVAYPSIHPSGKMYVWEIGLETPFAPSPDWLTPFILPTVPEPRQQHEYQPSREVRYKTAYGQNALSREAQDVAGTRVDRNSRLYRAALKMGSLIADGKIDRGTVESVLLTAAVACGLVHDDGEAQQVRTIASGVSKGMESPRGSYSKR